MHSATSQFFVVAGGKILAIPSVPRDPADAPRCSTLFDVTDPLLGTLVGRYRLTHLLGEGGMGRVYSATHEVIGGRVAIKVMSTFNDELVSRFFAEARAVNLVEHDAIVKVSDLSQLPDGRPYIVMEHVAGETLRALIQRREPLPVGGAIDVMTEVLLALDAVHAAGIVHRDLKPDNIIVTPNGRVRVLDFGVAKLLTGGPARTHTGAAVGTPEYMAPEQIRGTAVDARTDVYAAAVALFEAITGVRPFDGDSEFDVMRAHLEAPPPSVRGARPELDGAIDDVLARALAKSPSDRFASAGEMATALRAARATLPADQQRPLEIRFEPEPAPMTKPPTANARPGRSGRAGANVENVPEPTPSIARTPPRARSNKRVWIAIVAGCAMAGAATGVLLVRGDPDRATEPAVGRSQVASDAAIALAPVAPTPSPIAPTPIAPAPAPPVTRNLPRSLDPPARRAIASTPSSPAPLPAPTSRWEAHDNRPLPTTPFDPLPYNARAIALASKLAPDPILTMVTYLRVRPDGLLTPSQLPITFVLRSNAGAPDASGQTAHCVQIVSTPNGMMALLREIQCAAPATSPPRCTPREVWSRARTSAAGPTDVAMLTWFEDRWIFVRDNAAQAIDDDCGGPRRRAAPSGLDIADPKRFDAMLYIPAALERARATKADAQLVGIELPSVQADGRVDISMAESADAGGVRYSFRSASQTGDRACDLVVVGVSIRGVEVGPLQLHTAHCPAPGTPQCSLVEVWQRMTKAVGNTGNRAYVSWFNGVWRVTPIDASHGVSKDFPDDCGR